MDHEGAGDVGLGAIKVINPGHQPKDDLEIFGRMGPNEGRLVEDGWPMG